jgi:demethylmenaquinone methyltransferase/2-methoxy-6-polyprenyl-1,4-benzoquinol methylase
MRRPDKGNKLPIGIHIEDKAAYVRVMFSAIADRYDFLNRLLSFQQDERWRRFAVSKSGLQLGGLALDVATGTAKMAQLLAQYNNGSSVVGVDFCPNMLDKARAKLTDSSDGSRICLISGNILRLPFPDNTFDCATIGFALRNVVSIAGAFREMARVVKPDGRVVSLELTRPSLWLVRTIYYIYLCHIAPYIGGLISGSREAYTYLPQSILEFPSPQEVKEIMEEAGLQGVETYRLTLGSATVHAGIKGG